MSARLEGPVAGAAKLGASRCAPRQARSPRRRPGPRARARLALALISSSAACPDPLLALLGLLADPVGLGLAAAPRRAPGPSPRPRPRPSRPACGPAPRPRGAHPRCPASPAPRSPPRAAPRSRAPPRRPPRRRRPAARQRRPGGRPRLDLLDAPREPLRRPRARVARRPRRATRLRLGPELRHLGGERFAIRLRRALQLLERLLGAVAGRLGAARAGFRLGLRLPRSAAIRCAPRRQLAQGRPSPAASARRGPRSARASAAATRSSLTRTHSSACLAIAVHLLRRLADRLSCTAGSPMRRATYYGRRRLATLAAPKGRN